MSTEHGIDKPEVDIVILNFNGHSDTATCLESVFGITYPNYRVIVVDNASTDGSVAHIVEWARAHDINPAVIKGKHGRAQGEIARTPGRAGGEQLVVIENDSNLGFSTGNNVGIRFALDTGARYVLLLNNDTVVSSDFLDHMVETSESDERVGICGAKIYDIEERDMVQYAGGEVSKLRVMCVSTGSGQRDHGQFEGVREVSFVTGCCMLVSSKAFEQAGLLPEEYFMYLEDLDFCTMVSRKGFLLKADLRAVIFHRTNALSPFNVFLRERNRLIYARKYLSNLERAAFHCFFVLSRIIRVVQYALTGRSELSAAIIKGVKEGYGRGSNRHAAQHTPETG